MKTFLLSLHSEYYKTRKTLAFWGAIILPLFLCTVVFAAYYLRSEKILKELGSATPDAIWGKYAFMILSVMGTLLLPMYLIFMTYSVNNIEHKADTWKSIFSLPIPKWSIYFSKVSYTIILVALSMVLFVALTLGYGFLLNYLVPKYHLLDADLVKFSKGIGTVYLKLFFSSLGIISIQFLLSLIWKDFLKPMGIGFLLFVTSIIILQWEYSYLLPFTHPVKAIMSTNINKLEIFTNEVWVSFTYAVAFFTAGYFIVIKRSVK